MMILSDPAAMHGRPLVYDLQLSVATSEGFIFSEPERSWTDLLIGLFFFPLVYETKVTFSRGAPLTVR